MNSKPTDLLPLLQVIDYYKDRVVRIAADKPQAKVAEQIRKSL